MKLGNPFAILGTRAAGAVAVLVASAAAALLVTTHSPAQQPKAAPKKAPAKAAPAPPPQQQPQAQQGEQPKISFVPWTKICPKGTEANAKAVCLTGRDGRLETGMPVVAAVLIEPEGAPRKVLRITLPLGMALQPGTRVIVDQGQPITAPYVMCAPTGCMADYEASNELIDKMKKGQGLVVQGINGSGQPVSLMVPLADFAKVHDSPPMDQKAFEEQQRKMQADFEKRRQQLEAQQQPQH